MPFMMRDLPLTEAVYTFTPHDAAPVHIAASTLRGLLETWRHSRTGVAYPVTTCVMDDGLRRALERGDLGVEEAHAMRLPDAALDVPGIIGEWGDTHISIDGAHRLWRRWQRGDREFPAYVVPEVLWREFTITDMPGSGDLWRELNKVEVRTPEMQALIRALGGE